MMFISARNIRGPLADGRESCHIVGNGPHFKNMQVPKLGEGITSEIWRDVGQLLTLRRRNIVGTE